MRVLGPAGRPSRDATGGAAPEEQRVQKISGISKVSAIGVMTSTGRSRVYAALESTSAAAVLRMVVADLGGSDRGVIIRQEPLQNASYTSAYHESGFHKIKTTGSQGAEVYPPTEPRLGCWKANDAECTAAEDSTRPQQ